jgi:hypothetical protein
MARHALGPSHVFKLTGEDHTGILRVPVPPGAHADAERVVRHFEANRVDR